jgi:hypothetical protein
MSGPLTPPEAAASGRAEEGSVVHAARPGRVAWYRGRFTLVDDILVFDVFVLAGVLFLRYPSLVARRSQAAGGPAPGAGGAESKGGAAGTAAVPGAAGATTDEAQA